MKQKISITVEKDLILSVEKLLNNGIFRNRSHIVEVALNKFIEEKNDK